MSFPRYPEYKDSGVEWLGAVPKHWQVKRIRHVAQLNPSKTEIKQLDPEMLVSFLPMEAVGDAGSLNLERETTIAEVQSGYTYFREGDVTYAKITPCFENGKGAHMRGLLNGIGFGSTELVAVRPDYCQTTSEYLNWTFRSPVFRRLAEASMYGAGGQKRVPDDFTRDFALGFPKIEEQVLISRFLSIETAKLDNLMAEQEKLITLLKEKRQAVISHAVTKGLDPAVPMKDSGVEWLGEVPAHWQLKRVKHFVNSFAQGWSPQCESYPVASEDEWGVLKVGCVNGGIFNPEENKSLPAELDPLPELGIRKGDLLISRANTRELVGSAAVALRDYPNLLLCDKLYRLRLDGAVISTEFVASYLSTGQVRGQIELSASGASSSMLNISQATILELVIALPADEEQKEIVELIESEQIKLNALIAQAQHAIDLLKERRTALISAAVTGQIDVRGLIKEEQEQAA
ncbi:restriction endonuclease subunit S [Pseudomonas anguilliseptica]|uniref:restriction endonuclease subunit S n=1 Tax=Pseudomonas anguilliseptica TaxID=53406 RepID=UPI0022AE8892|nr:restriction endonuclease subunit S [Pseudomonas anguilliseptica]MCZ4324626.1 restriction endonuclease subunit S [Pseudomonas anguilliseptica]